jgi:hypothetical protein
MFEEDMDMFNIKYGSLPLSASAVTKCSKVFVNFFVNMFMVCVNSFMYKVVVKKNIT